MASRNWTSRLLTLESLGNRRTKVPSNWSKNKQLVRESTEGSSEDKDYTCFDMKFSSFPQNPCQVPTSRLSDDFERSWSQRSSSLFLWVTYVVKHSGKCHPIIRIKKV